MYTEHVLFGTQNFPEMSELIPGHGILAIYVGDEMGDGKHFLPLQYGWEVSDKRIPLPSPKLFSGSWFISHWPSSSGDKYDTGSRR